MKLYLYKQTPFGLERLNENALTVKEAVQVLKSNPDLVVRDAESINYAQLHGSADISDGLTVKEEEIAKNLKTGLAIALAAGLTLFILEKLIP